MQNNENTCIKTVTGRNPPEQRCQPTTWDVTRDQLGRFFFLSFFFITRTLSATTVVGTTANQLAASLMLWPAAALLIFGYIFPQQEPAAFLAAEGRPVLLSSTLELHRDVELDDICLVVLLLAPAVCRSYADDF